VTSRKKNLRWRGGADAQFEKWASCKSRVRVLRGISRRCPSRGRGRGRTNARYLKCPEKIASKPQVRSPTAKRNREKSDGKKQDLKCGGKDTLKKKAATQAAEKKDQRDNLPPPMKVKNLSLKDGNETRQRWGCKMKRPGDRGCHKSRGPNRQIGVVGS